MKSLIIGITGCSGSYLTEHLLEKGYEVLGIKRKTSSLQNITHILDKIKLFDIDLDDKDSIIKIMEQAHPGQIYFLAAANQFQDISKIYKTNVDGTIAFFESLSRCFYRGRILVVSSSAVYGVQEYLRPLTENDDLLPMGHYGLSKVFQEKIADYYRRNYNLDVIIARPFNFTGPREYPSYVCTDFARQIVDIERRNKEPVIKVGNLEHKRDFTDVRDMVKGYELLASRGEKGEVYNVCSGNALSVKTILEKLLSLSVANISVQVDTEKMKGGKNNVQSGDNSKIFSKVGWAPEISLDTTLEDMLIYNRKLNRT